ncbi:hypothetical protein B0T26DRAFT_680834 [Lasiosphaeria miniovina]|uniref:Uncharacterized protein n=1 Tax=Lasiosphaeria miniovina TaxID=1954250 RepID=A0AA39ZT87_9PEZI|nr:uncharacterized protein B0T26DRAFT_680834 [Lasiosphaeria miniovina]KAK0703089.1 hypothetical protein B0T26DRAFT_680834 [Lasiosphaeria miniovina]
MRIYYSWRADVRNGSGSEGVQELEGHESTNRPGGKSRNGLKDEPTECPRMGVTEGRNSGLNGPIRKERREAGGHDLREWDGAQSRGGGGNVRRQPGPSGELLDLPALAHDIGAKMLVRNLTAGGSLPPDTSPSSSSSHSLEITILYALAEMKLLYDLDASRRGQRQRWRSEA